MKKPKLFTSQKGFTVIELMISTVVFGTILLLCAVGFIQVGKLFYKGVSIMRSQEAARNLAEELIQEMQFTNNDVVLDQTDVDPDTSRVAWTLCIGAKRYYIHVDVPSSPTQRAVEKLQDLGAATPCSETINNRSLNSGQELLPENMRVPKNGFVIDPCKNGLCGYIKIVVAFGTNDVFLDADHQVCKGSFNGSQFCGVRTIETSALRRVRL